MDEEKRERGSFYIYIYFFDDKCEKGCVWGATQTVERLPQPSHFGLRQFSASHWCGYDGASGV
jgi:hypothetical protein